MTLRPTDHGGAADAIREQRGAAPFPAKFRRRLALFCAGSVALATAAFAVGSFLSIREYRLDRFREGAEREAGLHLLRLVDRQEASLPALVDILDDGRPEVIVEEAGEVARSARDVDLDDVRAEVPEDDGSLASSIASVDGTSYLVVAAPLPDRPGRAYFLFDRENFLRDVSNVARVLLIAWIIVTVVVAALSMRVARRALWPVRRAADAANDLASGLLGTRLPVEGHDEFAAWAASFNRMASELERRIERERRFTADVAHELRTPVGSSLAAASLLETQIDELPPDARRPAELIVQELRRLRRLVDDLLEISLLESGRDRLSLGDVDLLERIHRLLALRGWDDEVELTGESRHLLTDPRRVDRVVGNLIDNALRHGAPPVEVLVTGAETEARIEVVDRGRGVPADGLGQLFEPFFKYETERPGPGSGLGLAIAAHHARLLGGRLEVTSRPGDTRFLLVLPVIASSEAADDQP